MPVYTYRCHNCGIEFTRKQLYSDKQVTRCPVCRTSIVRRVPQLPAIVFKGSGWYSTDHRSASGRGPAFPQEPGGAETSTGAKNGR